MLQPGRRLGPYEIVASLGAGGMGEVYQATDTRLGRSVAIKVLPPALAAHPERRARFEREARAVSSLAHPHVCSLHDIGEEDGIQFLVLEHCEGETLEARLQRAPLPLQDVLRYGAQIAEALDAAHGRGIVHRDLKPGNVMLTKSGVKLLDFGLARAAAGEGERSETFVDMPTVAKEGDRSLTAEGTILGTYPYMAPEQIEGGEVDARSDIFSLGALLYEMAAGRRAFQGKSAASVMAAVLKEEPPPPSKVQPVAPPALDHVVSRCLAKNPEERWQSARDVAVELRWIAEAGSQAGIAAPVAKRRKSRERLAWAVAAAAIAAAVILGIAAARDAGEPQLVRADLVPPNGWEYEVSWGLAVSPDGSQIVFHATDARGRAALWVRPVGGDAARMLDGTERGGLPFWSPDGRHIGFFADGQLKRIAVAGGPAQVLCEAPSPRGGTWSEDGTIVFSGEFRKGLLRVAASGGTPEELTRLDEERGDISHRWPEFLPGGRALLFLVQTAEGGMSGDDSRIETLDLASGERKRLVRANSSVAYSPTGHVLFWRDGALLAQPFDADSLALTGGDPLLLASDIGYSTQERAAFAISREGTLVYQKGRSGSPLEQLAWYDREGRKLEEIGRPQQIHGAELSHDGTRVAFESAEDIWIRDLARDSVTRLTFDPTVEFWPRWSPDDRWIAFSSLGRQQRGTTILRKAASGAGEAELLAQAADDGRPEGWSPDGDAILFTELDPRTQDDLKVLSIDRKTTEDFLKTAEIEAMGRFSPDGRWVVYAAGSESNLEIFVTTRDGTGRWQVSNHGGVEPRWSRDGGEIVYLQPRGRIMAVEVEAGEGFRAGPPRLLVEAPIGGPFSLHPDGERLLVTLDTRDQAMTPLTLVVNWPALLGK